MRLQQGFADLKYAAKKRLPLRGRFLGELEILRPCGSCRRITDYLQPFLNSFLMQDRLVDLHVFHERAYPFCLCRDDK